MTKNIIITQEVASSPFGGQWPSKWGGPHYWALDELPSHDILPSSKESLHSLLFTKPTCY